MVSLVIVIFIFSTLIAVTTVLLGFNLLNLKSIKRLLKRKNKIIDPPWKAYPGQKPHCSSWRMVDGKDYIDAWFKYIDGLNEDKFEKYFNKYNIPKEWKGKLKQYWKL